MKEKFLTAVLAVLMLSACAVRENEAAFEAETDDTTGNTATEAVLSQNASDETVPTVNTETSDSRFIPPDEAFLKSVFNESGYDIVFSLDSSGNYAAADIAAVYGAYLKNSYDYMMSEEYYEEIKEDQDITASSYEEYRAMMEEMWYDEFQRLSDGYDIAEGQVFFVISFYNYYDNDISDEKIYLRTAEWLFDLIEEDPEIAERIADNAANGNTYFVMASGSVSGENAVSVSACIDEKYIDIDGYSEHADYCFEDEISIDGRKGITINGVFVPADTEKLFLTRYSMIFVEGDEIMPEDCFIVCNEDFPRSVEAVDLHQIAEKLPKLTALYLYDIPVKDTQYISEMENLDTLCYSPYVEKSEFYVTAADTPFINLPKLKNLWLYGDYTDYTFLNDMPNLENIFVSVDSMRNCEAMPYDSVFDCPAVTGLEIEIYEDLTGLERLTNLQHLHLTNRWVHTGDSTTPVDLAAIGELKELTCLRIEASGHEPLNMSVIGNLSKLENLKMTRVKTNKDWSFMSRLTSLKSIYLFEVSYISNSDIEQMPWLEEIKMYDVDGIDLSIYETIPGLSNGRE